MPRTQIYGQALHNRRIARSVSSQIGKNYRELSAAITEFMDAHFVSCTNEHLAKLCDNIQVGTGISMRLNEFEEAFFPLADSVKRRFPIYAHIHISTWGLQFEYPEHHFLRDMETALRELLETQADLTVLGIRQLGAKHDRDKLADLVAREKFLSRSIVSAAFSFIDSYLSGIFFTALHTGRLGKIGCDEEFLKYARTKESDSLARRIDRVVRFASGVTKNGDDEPFRTFISVGKRYRDAIHHTTPFERKDVESGGRLIALYEIDHTIALRCITLSCQAATRIADYLDDTPDATEIATRCRKLLEAIPTPK